MNYWEKRGRADRVSSLNVLDASQLHGTAADAYHDVRESLQEVLINSMELSSSGEADSHSASQETPSLL
jgi:hypothetical protein